MTDSMEGWFRKYLANVLSAYGLRGVQMVLSILAIPMLIANTGEVGFGLIIFLSSILGYLGFFDFGISDTLAKTVGEADAAGDASRLDREITSALGVFAAIGSLLFVLTAGFVVLAEFGDWFPAGEEAWSILVMLTGYMAVFALPYMALQGIYRGLQAQPVLNFALSIGRIGAVGGAIYASWRGVSLEWVYLIFNADRIVVVPLILIHLRGARVGIHLHPRSVSLAEMRSLFQFGRWIMLARVANFLEYQLDNLLVMIVVGPAGVAAYTVITTPFRMIQQVSGLSAQAIVPVVSGGRAIGSAGILARILTTGIRWHNALLAVAWTLCLINADYLFGVWLGGRYEEYHLIMKVLIGFQAVWQSGCFLGMVATGLGHVRPLGMIAIWAGIANLILSLVLVNIIGLYGVIVGTLVAGACAAPIAGWIVSGLVGLKPRDYFANCAVGQLPAVLLCVGFMLMPFGHENGALLLFVSTPVVIGLNLFLAWREKGLISRNLSGASVVG